MNVLNNKIKDNYIKKENIKNEIEEYNKKNNKENEIIKK